MSEERAVPDALAGSEQNGQGAADEAVDVGQRLRLAREARGVSIKEASMALRLSPHQVEALEANDWFQQPRTVSRGFVRNYARYLELDAGPLMRALDHVPMLRGPELAVGARAAVNMPREGEGDRRDYVRVIAGVIVLALAILACFFVPVETWQSGIDSIKALVSGEDAASEDAAEAAEVTRATDEPPGAIRIEPEPVPVSVAPEPVSAAAVPVSETTFPAAPPPATPPPAAPSPAAPPPVVAQLPVEPAPVQSSVPIQPAPLEPLPAQSVPAQAAVPVVPAVPVAEVSSASSSPEGTLVFSFTQPSWVEVRDGSGQIIHSQINPAGSQREVIGRAPFTLVVGNAAYVSLQYKGKPVDLSPRSRDDVARLVLE